MQDSLHKTLENQNLEYNQVEPLFVHPSSQIKEQDPIDHVLEGFRLLSKTTLSCFQALGIIHTNYNVIPLKIETISATHYGMATKDCKLR